MIRYRCVWYGVLNLAWPTAHVKVAGRRRALVIGLSRSSVWSPPRSRHLGLFGSPCFHLQLCRFFLWTPIRIAGICMRKQLTGSSIKVSSHVENIRISHGENRYRNDKIRLGLVPFRILRALTWNGITRKVEFAWPDGYSADRQRTLAWCQPSTEDGMMD
jgi:hypothetical protein